MQALLRQEKYTKVLRTVRKYKLLDRDKRYQKRAGYLPTLPFYLALAEYREGLLTRRQLQQRLLTYLPADTAGREEQSQSVRELLNELRRVVPEVVRAVEESMEGKGDVAAV